MVKYFEWKRNCAHGSVAQWLAHLIPVQEVVRSSRAGFTFCITVIVHNVEVNFLFHLDLPLCFWYLVPFVLVDNSMVKSCSLNA